MKVNTKIEKKSTVKKAPAKKPTAKAKPVEKLMPMLPVLEEEFYAVVGSTLNESVSTVNNTEPAEVAILKGDFKGLMAALNGEGATTYIVPNLAQGESVVEIGLQQYLDTVRAYAPDKAAAIEARILADLRASEITDSGGMTYNDAFELFGNKTLEGINLIYDFNQKTDPLDVGTIKALRDLFKK